MRPLRDPGAHRSRRSPAAAIAAGLGAALVLVLGIVPGGEPGAAPPPSAATGFRPVAAAAPVPPPMDATVAAAAPVPPPVDATVAALPAEVECRPDSDRARRDGSLGGLVLGVAGLLCGPLGPAGALPATELEAEEPERLYALVTRDRAVRPLRYAPDDLVPLPGGLYQAREEVVQQLKALFAAAREEGHDYLSVTSGFRDHDTQAGTHEDWVRRLGPERAEEVSARAGHSEHQLGLAVDVTGECGGYDCFGQSDDGRWVAANAHRFGFIVRYPEGGEEVTGYAYEPWHLRYVGPRVAWAMHLQGEVYWEDFAPVALEAAALEG